ncbi:hypothetical protein PAPYR_876 [Paratrimastix pyriformis]|uniref:Transmembrane protein 230 n=1 Tax=Paratrimastix pyriformis TaxID=342808 RepID=A0ABQ8UT19_9EUKA|nr:hypothetical protein PAPYR_876 [Paratrimastix pyriformis]
MHQRISTPPTEDAEEMVPLRAVSDEILQGSHGSTPDMGGFVDGDNEEDVHDDRFAPVHYQLRVPWKAIGLALFLFTTGTVLLFFGISFLTGLIKTQYWDRGYPMTVLGAICFLPGSYVTWIAYRVWKGDPNYSYDDIPDL